MTDKNTKIRLDESTAIANIVNTVNARNSVDITNIVKVATEQSSSPKPAANNVENSTAKPEK